MGQKRKKNLKFANVKAVQDQCRGGLSRPLHSQWLRGVWTAGKEKLYVTHDIPTPLLSVSLSPPHHKRYVNYCVSIYDKEHTGIFAHHL